MDATKMKRLATTFAKIRDLPCLVGLAILIVSVTITVRAEEHPKDTMLQDEQALAFGVAKRSKDNQHKFGWGKRSRGSRLQLGDNFDNDGYDVSKRGVGEAPALRALAAAMCKTGTQGCVISKLRQAGDSNRNGWDGSYGKRSSDDDEEFMDSEDDNEEENTIVRDANDDRNGWGGNYGRDVDDAPSELSALLSAAKRRFAQADVTKRHGNGWHGAYGKRNRNGWNSAYGKKKRSVSSA